MKQLIYAFFLFSCSSPNQLKGQDLVGIWQKDSKEISSASMDCYHFFNDGKFIYYFSEYDESKRTIAIKGTYQLKSDNNIIFKVNSFIEVDGGVYSKRGGTEHNGWAIIEDKGIKEIKQNSKEVISVIEKCHLNNNDKISCIIIDDDEFYKIDNVPKDLFNK